MKITNITRSAIVLHSAERMFDLVDDIERYPDYMVGCRDAKVLVRTEQEVVARLDLAKAGIRQSFTTRNRLYRPERIVMTLEEGPFTCFQGAWHFKVLTDTACKVSLELEFGFKSGLVHLAGARLFTQVANNLVAATTARADVID
jgi:ribosome-associated toxin RatA of RatAB toxin-antitoxin module